MLQTLRDNSQGVIAKVIIGLIIAVFALWGAESIIGGFVTTPPAAEVNGEEVSAQQLGISTQNLLASIGGNIDSFDQGLLEQIAMNQLIEETLLRQAAQNMSMRVSDDRIDRAILETPQFQIDGVFNSDLAVRTMASQAFNVSQYRQQLQNSMLLSQLANAYTSSSFVTETELQAIAELRLQSRDFRYLSIPIGTRTLGEAISDGQISDYYLSNQNAFTVDESIQLDYVMLDKAELSESIAIDDSAVLAQYERERQSVVSSAERRASHILFEVGAGVSQSAAHDQALAAKQRLDSGEDFGGLARELSDDTASAEYDGDIGFSDGTVFPQAIEDALLAMEIGDVSEPIATEFGVHLLMLTAADDNEYPAFEEVSERITRTMRSAEAEQLFAARLETLSNMAFESQSLIPISTALDLEILSSEFITRRGGQGIFSNAAVIAEAFSEDVLVGEHNSSVIELNDSQAIVLKKKAHNEAYVRPLDDLRGEIAVMIRTDMERRRAESLGLELVEALQSSSSIDELLVGNDLAWLTQTGVTRTSTAINTEIIDAVFAMPKPEDTNPVYEGMTLNNGTYVVIELGSVNPGNAAELSTPDRSTIIESLINEKTNGEFGAYIANLRNNAKISTRRVEEAL